jgi:hypothetical protein
MRDEHERDQREATLSRGWDLLAAYEAAHPEHPYATVLRLRATNLEAGAKELAEALGRHTGPPSPS